MANIPQQPGTKPDPVKHALVCITRHEVRGAAGVKGPCFLAENLLGDGFEVIAVDQTVQGRFCTD
jgi:hypothetical protein